jgi:hypothetical protein
LAIASDEINYLPHAYTGKPVGGESPAQIVNLLDIAFDRQSLLELGEAGDADKVIPAPLRPERP